MAATFIEAALRSVLLAIAVLAALNIFRVRNVVAQKWAWAGVLAGAFLMPLLLPVAARLPRLPAATLLVPAQWIPQVANAPAAQPEATQTALALSNAAVPAAIADSAGPETITSIPTSPAKIAGPQTANSARQTDSAMPWNPFRRISVAGFAAFLYLAGAAALLFRLLFGVASTFLLWRRSQPVNVDIGFPLNVRSSPSVSSPATIGSGILLPADHATWDPEKLRVVLAHEGSHIRQGDFYLQLVAALYAALVWPSPLGWWLKRKLYDLGETISDRCGLDEAADGSSYAQILLEFAAAPRIAVLGVAMARPSTISRRIERLLNEQAFRQAFAGGRRALVAAALVPVAFFAVTGLIRVQAAIVPQQLVWQSASAQAAPAQPQVPASPAAPASAQAAAAPEVPQSSDVPSSPTPPQDEPAPAPNPAPAPAPEPSPDAVTPRVHVDLPAIHLNVQAQHVEVPAVHVNVPAQHIEVKAVHVDVPAKHIDIPAQHIDVPAVHVDVPAHSIDIPEKHIDIPARHIDVPAIHIDVPASTAPSGSDGHASNGAGGELLAMLSGFGHALFLQAAPGSTESTFDRTLTFSGKLVLTIGDGSGSIQIHRGAANQVHVHATVRANDADDEQAARDLAANPPIEQNENMIRIGEHGDHGENHHNISIDYVIEAPADTDLKAAIGSGNITDEGVGQDAKLASGSGNVTATGLEGAYKISTGSGNIDVDGSGQGDAKVQSGSGKIDVKGVHGALIAQSGSGQIKVDGTPSAPWRLQTGSGSIDLTTGNAPITIDARAGSGTIKSDRPMTTQASEDKHHMTFEINGGGTEVHVDTGSGEIRLH
jgi:beta-lactamase regulating signal transducer with metallopeptidase domain/DUF4097 and DUF4098 domain-containing protein YvlB